MKSKKQQKRTNKKGILFLLPLVCCLLTFLSGCVRYDVGINFKNQHQGTIVQHIQLGEQLTNFSQSEANKWLSSIEGRAKKLQGKTKRVSSQEIVVTIPFSNGKELASKFNQFFNPIPNKNSTSAVDTLDLVQLNSEMFLNQKNFLFFERDSLNLSVDLRALGMISDQGNLIVSPGELINLEFDLNTPYGSRSIVSENNLNSEFTNDSHKLVWQLKPGQINKIEAVFWVPSNLGIGTVFIILIVWAGFYLKYSFQSKRNPAKV